MERGKERRDRVARILQGRSEDFWRGAFLLLQEMMLGGHGARDVEAMVEQVVQALQELLGVPYAGMALVGEEGGPFHDTLVVVRGDIPPEVGSVLFPRVMGESKVVEVREGVVTWVGVPLMAASGQKLGVMFVGAPRELDEVDRLILRIVAAHAAIALENARLRERLVRMATTDPLTGVLNRRAFLARLDEELDRMRRGYVHRLGVVVMDVDGLKRVNDRWGHPVGDVYLQELARAMQAHTRRTDGVGRLGGMSSAWCLSKPGRTRWWTCCVGCAGRGSAVFPNISGFWQPFPREGGRSGGKRWDPWIARSCWPGSMRPCLQPRPAGRGVSCWWGVDRRSSEPLPGV